MNRERLKILRDHLAALPDNQFDMDLEWRERSCGTVACVGGWASYLAAPDRERGSMEAGAIWLGLSGEQERRLFWPGHMALHKIPKSDAIAAIDSMLANPDDEALPVWPE